MRILIANDDGIHSPGLLHLAQYLATRPEVGEVAVYAPAQEQSGMGHAFTFLRDLRVQPQPDFPVPAWSVQGTPADCVKYALTTSAQAWDLVISGPNHGANAGVAVFYSGTVAAAREANLWGLASMAISLPEINAEYLSALDTWLDEYFFNAWYRQHRPGVAWNVNFPDLSHGSVRGTRFCAMSQTMYQDAYTQGSEPDCWILAGHKPDQHQQQTDDAYLAQQYITVVPLQIPQTHFDELARLQAALPTPR